MHNTAGTGNREKQYPPQTPAANTTIHCCWPVLTPTIKQEIYHKLSYIYRFIRLNPNQPDLDYVYYMRGLTNLKADENAFQEFFGIDRADRDLSSTRQAFDDFKILLNSYPDSKYAANAKQLW
ncbi:Outer membrane protein assembly factor BamD [Alishewanella longhuensis]